MNFFAKSKIFENFFRTEKITPFVALKFLNSNNVFNK